MTNFEPNTYEGEFFQEAGLQGNFAIDLTKVIGMEVDNEMVDDEYDGDEVHNEKDLELLEQIKLGKLIVDGSVKAAKKVPSQSGSALSRQIRTCLAPLTFFFQN